VNCESCKFWRRRWADDAAMGDLGTCARITNVYYIDDIQRDGLGFRESAQDYESSVVPAGFGCVLHESQ
jgi:hypothetical protein